MATQPHPNVKMVLSSTQANKVSYARAVRTPKGLSSYTSDMTSIFTLAVDKHQSLTEAAKTVSRHTFYDPNRRTPQTAYQPQLYLNPSFKAGRYQPGDQAVLVLGDPAFYSDIAIMKARFQDLGYPESQITTLTTPSDRQLEATLNRVNQGPGTTTLYVTSHGSHGKMASKPNGPPIGVLMDGKDETFFVSEPRLHTLVSNSLSQPNDKKRFMIQIFQACHSGEFVKRYKPSVPKTAIAKQK
jgi:hypothetical protein